MLLVICLATAGIGANDPATEAKLAAGEVVLVDKPATGGAIAVEGLADVAATNSALWKALLDFEARLRGNSTIKAFGYYKPSTATEQWGAWEAQRFGMTIRYHNHYRLDRARNVLIHELDTTQTNDIKMSRGVYTFGPSPNNAEHLRLSYAVETDFGSAIPSFIKSWLAGQGVKDYLVDLVARAEAA